MTTDHKTIFFTNAMPFMSDDRIATLEDIPERVSSYGSFALAKGSQFRQIFDYHLVKARQAGLLGVVMDKWLRGGKPKGQGAAAGQGDEATPLGFDNLLFMVLVVSGGAGLSVVVALLEWVHRKTLGMRVRPMLDIPRGRETIFH